MKHNIRIAVVCLVAAPMLGGCAGLMKGMMAKMDPSAGDKKMVNDAVTAKKWDDVKKYCDSKYRKEGGKKLHYKAKRIACDADKAHSKEIVVAALKDPKCGEIVKVWEEHKSAVQRHRMLKKTFPDMAVRMGKCGKYGYVFKNMIHWGPHQANAIGRKAIVAMDAAGLPVEKEYLKWMGSQSSNPYDPKYGGYALEHYYNWRLKKGGKIDCKPYVKAWKVIEEADQMSWIYVFYRSTKCTAAADYVMKGLVSSRPKTRHRACMTLGIIGNKKHIKKMSILAKSDGSYKIKRRIKTYWVRDMCKQAVGQINMR